MEQQHIIENLKTIQRRINLACDEAGRSPEDVKLLLATKTVAPKDIEIAINEGYTLLGENKILEGLEKHESLSCQSCQWHIIGHVQTNKVKHILKYADVVQSVDRIKLVQ